MNFDLATPLQVIVDTDIGVDDAWALMMVLSQAQVLAVTMVHGNASVDQVTHNACLLLDLLDSQAPVFKGAERPLMGVPTLSSIEFMGADALGGYSQHLPRSTRPIESQPAALALGQYARQHPGEITLLALGPLTNLALAVRLDEHFAGHIRRLVIMGGAIEGRGNASSAAEFNIYADPEAARIVFEAGFSDIWLLSWETSLKYPFSWDEYASLKLDTSPRMQFAIGVMDGLAKFLKERLGAPGLILPDPLAAAICLEPGLVTEAPMANVSIEISGAVGRGLTAVDWQGLSASASKARIVTALDADKAFQILRDSLQRR
jgi:purine nucleosidase